MGTAGRERDGDGNSRTYTAAMAEHDLLSRRDDVLGAFSIFRNISYSALFAVQGDIAEGRDATAPVRSSVMDRAIDALLELPRAARGEDCGHLA